MLPVGRVCTFWLAEFQRATPLALGGIVDEAPRPVLIRAAELVCTLSSSSLVVEMELLSPPSTDIVHQPLGGLLVTLSSVEKAFVYPKGPTDTAALA